MANKHTAYTFISDTHAQCSMCKEIKLHKDFHQCKSYKHRRGCAYYCKECACANSRKTYKQRLNLDYKTERDKKKQAYIKRRYGITLQDYLDRIVQQKVCAICGVKLSTDDPNVHLDHCHKTGKLRSFLCGNCNRGIGSFHDDIHKLEKAIQYLNSHNSK